MSTILIYLLKVAFSLFIVALFFRLFLRKETFYRANKVAMFSLIFISLIVPFLKTASFSFGKVQSTINDIDLYITTLGEVVVTPSAESVGTEVNYCAILFSLWIAGVIYRIVRLLVSHVRIRSLLYGGYKIEDGKYKIVVGSGDIPSFSYFNNIFISAVDYSQDRESIITHEKAHIKLRHSYEIVFMEILVAIQWFNPFVYCLKKDLIDTHEFEADNYVIEKGVDSREYQHLLIKKAVGTGSYTLANSFNHSTLKKRITMMLKPKSGKSAWLKLAGVIPVTLISVSLFATQIENSLEFKDVTTAVTASEPNAGNLITVKDNDNKQSGNRESSKDEVFKKCDVMPEFPGGEAAFVNFISRNVKYPKVARENGIQGKVIVSFVIEKDGSVSDVTVDDGVDSALDNEAIIVTGNGIGLICNVVDPALAKEAIRLVESMPKWKPGEVEGKPVRTEFKIPIFFRLNNVCNSEKP